MTKIRFEQTAAFDKDHKRLEKRFRSLPSDLETLKAALSAQPEGSAKHAAVLTNVGNISIVKIRMACRSLRESSLRVIYAYDKETSEIWLVEVYFKGDKETEDRERIRDFLQSKA